jgi:hypothetical protein
MKFLVKQKSVLPKLQLDIITESRNGYRQTLDFMYNASVTFSMYEKHTEKYHIINSNAEIIEDGENNHIVSYQFKEKDTLLTGDFIGYFSIINNSKTLKLPIRDVLEINIIESISDPSFCCRSNRTVTSIVPSNNTIK